MAVHLDIDAKWLSEDGVWLASSPQWPGLVVEAPAWGDLLREIELVLPDFLEAQGIDPQGASFTVRAEANRTLSAA